MDGVLDNLENALRTWADKLAEIWNLLTQDPETFRGGTIWNIIRSIHGSLQAIGLALLVLFFLYGVIKQTTNLREVKRPEMALRLFLRFAIARVLVVYGMDFMTSIFEICQGVINRIINTVGVGGPPTATLPPEIVDAVELNVFDGVVGINRFQPLVNLIDGNSQRKFGSYVYNNVTVHQGADEKSASVEISTIDAVKQ